MRNPIVLVLVSLALAAAACGGKEDGGDAGPYPSEVVATFMEACESSAVESSGGVVSADQARSYCRCTLDELERSLTMDEFLELENDAGPLPPEVSDAIATCDLSGGEGAGELETVPPPTAPADPSAQTFSGEGYSFAVPADWEQVGFEPSRSLPAETLSTVTFSSGAETDGITVAVFALPSTVTADDLGWVASQTSLLLSGLYERVLEGPSATTVGGLPALYVVAEGANQDGDEVVARSAFVFDGRTQYALECQYAHANEAEVRPGCQLALGTFRVEEP